MTNELLYTVANHYEFDGEGVVGSLDTSSVSGDPIASLSVDGTTAFDVTVTDHPLGWWLQGTVKVVRDAYAVVAYVVLPRANLADGPEELQAFSVVVKHRTSIGGEGLVKGALELYDLRPLQVTASAVQSLAVSVESAETGYESRDWEAWYNRMPGVSDSNLHVHGTVVLPSGSVRVSLQLGNPGIVPEPGTIVLDLIAEVPEVGDDMVVEREVDWQDDVGPDVVRVVVRGATSAFIDVTEVS